MRTVHATGGTTRWRWCWSGRIARPHGIRGQVIVNPETDFPDERFRRRAASCSSGATARRAADDRRRRGFIRAGRSSALDGRRHDERRRGARRRRTAGARVERLPPLPAGTFYRHDLIGCGVRDAAGAVGRRGDGRARADRAAAGWSSTAPRRRGADSAGVGDLRDDRRRRARADRRSIRRTGCSRLNAARRT